MKNRVFYWMCVVGCVLLAGFFLLNSLTMAWVGSFPGRDTELYRARFYWQLGAGVASLLVAVFVAIRYRQPTDRKGR